MADFGLIKMRFPLPKRLDTTLKTDSAYLLTGLLCCLNLEITNTVIGDQVHHDTRTSYQFRVAPLQRSGHLFFAAS